MVKWIKYLLPAVLIVALLGILVKSCNIYDKYSVMKGQYDALAGEYNKYRTTVIKEVTDLRNIISQKDKEIRNINAGIVDKEGKISTLHTQTAKLESANATLKDKDAKIYNLEQQLSLWKQKFAIAETIISDKDKIIFSLNEKYEAQLQITTRYKQLYENEATLRGLAEQRIKLADKKLQGLRFQLNLGKGVVIVLGGLILYGLVS